MSDEKTIDFKSGIPLPVKSCMKFPGKPGVLVEAIEMLKDVP